jgi:hypothetical protein
MRNFVSCAIKIVCKINHDLSPDLYNMFNSDIPTDPNTILATYADDTVILSIYKNPITASDNSQKHTSKIETRSKKWKTKINENKSAYITFT